MKTNQVLTRKMGQFEVFQRTSDGMFNATTLLKQWNALSGQGKKLDHFFENQSTKEFISTIGNRENLHTQNSVYVKSRASRGSNAGTWMHPLLFIDFAMWINSEFKYDVLRFVYDQLVKYRHDAGDAYRELGAAISQIVDKSLLSKAMPELAKMLNYVVFNSHESRMRNKADESKMRELYELESDIVKLIGFGFIKNFAGIKSYLRQRWSERWQPKVLTA